MNTNSFRSGYAQSGGLNTIIHKILYISDPDKILLLSVTYDYFLTENIFMKHTVQELRSSHYNLLILTNEKESKSPVEQVMVLYNHLKEHKKLQLQIKNIHEFNHDLKSGKEYAIQIVSKAMIWYDKGEVSLDYPKIWN